MQRIGLLNGNNITYDKDNTAGLLASMTAGVIEGFGTSGSGATTNVQSGKALIECIRTNGEKVMVYFENTADVVVDFTGTKKVYIAVDQAKLDDGSNNAEDGTGVASIQTGASYPASNYVALYSIASGTPTDARVGVKSKLARTGQIPYRLSYFDVDGVEQFLNFGSSGEVLRSNGPTNIPSWQTLQASIIGEIKIWPTASAPTGWFICDGSAISRSTYSGLFSAIGTTFGIGDGSTTFNLPDLKGKTIVGFNTLETEFNSIGKTGGAKTHLLTANESGLPSHSHNVPVQTGGAGGTNAVVRNAVQNASLATTTAGPSDASQAHNNLQPYMALNFIIKY